MIGILHSNLYGGPHVQANISLTEDGDVDEDGNRLNTCFGVSIRIMNGTIESMHESEVSEDEGSQIATLINYLENLRG